MAQQNEKVVSPVGVSQYAWLTQPDTRFDENGHYKTNLIVSTDDATELTNAIDNARQKAVELAKEKAKGKKIKEADAPYTEELDDDGKPTGNTIFKFKCKAKIVAKDGTIIPNKVALFDAKGKPMTDVNVWSGSEIKVSAELIPYYTAMVGAGVSMRLRAVQILKLVEGGGGNAKGYGFDKQEGYEHKEQVNDVISEDVPTEATDF
tara:strand:- start:1226 stop:1843 length:618 start_codon:yes stop_codon:yes gene_type:complete